MSLWTYHIFDYSDATFSIAFDVFALWMAEMTYFSWLHEDISLHTFSYT